MKPTAGDEATGNLVHFEFVEFVDTNFRGVESAEGQPKDGYLIYNAHRKDFGYGTFRRSDDYTLEYDVLAYIQNRHPAFMTYIKDSGGFYLEGQWHGVDTAGELTQR